MAFIEVMTGPKEGGITYMNTINPKNGIIYALNNDRDDDKRYKVKNTYPMHLSDILWHRYIIAAKSQNVDISHFKITKISALDIIEPDTVARLDSLIEKGSKKNVF